MPWGNPAMDYHHIQARNLWYRNRGKHFTYVEIGQKSVILRILQAWHHQATTKDWCGCSDDDDDGGDGDGNDDDDNVYDDDYYCYEDTFFGGVSNRGSLYSTCQDHLLKQSFTTESVFRKVTL